jgi:hypothetical protein
MTSTRLASVRVASPEVCETCSDARDSHGRNQGSQGQIRKDMAKVINGFTEKQRGDKTKAIEFKLFEFANFLEARIVLPMSTVNTRSGPKTYSSAVTISTRSSFCPPSTQSVREDPEGRPPGQGPGAGPRAWRSPIPHLQAGAHPEGRYRHHSRPG